MYPKHNLPRLAQHSQPFFWHLQLPSNRMPQFKHTDIGFNSNIETTTCGWLNHQSDFTDLGGSNQTTERFRRRFFPVAIFETC